jgi:putative ABC transport system substrate-binding protein
MFSPFRETKGDAKTAEDAARGLEKEKVNLIYTTATSVTLPAKRATTEIPIVFCAGADLVNLGLVENFAHPGGRLTGVYDLSTDLTAKRLEILKEIVPKLRWVVTYYNAHNPVAVNSSRLAREATQLQNVELLEQNVASVEELQTAMQTLRAGEVDAYFQVSDPLVLLYGQLITDTAKTKRLPTMFLEESLLSREASPAMA